MDSIEFDGFGPEKIVQGYNSFFCWRKKTWEKGEVNGFN